MATFREMQDRITLDYLNRSDMTSETRRAIVRAIKHYEKERFWFNGTATAIAVGTGSFSVTGVPSDFLALDFVTVRDSSADPVVSIRSYDRIVYQNSNLANSGVPTEICHWHDQFILNRKPSSATTITVHYTHSLPALSADADTNAWTSAGEDLIVHHATVDLLANVLRYADKDTIDRHQAQEQAALERLRNGNDMRMRAGSERAWQQHPKKSSNG